VKNISGRAATSTLNACLRHEKNVGKEAKGSCKIKHIFFYKFHLNENVDLGVPGY
jgi:hypothetical protein